MLDIDLKNGKFNRPQGSGWFVDQDFIPRNLSLIHIFSYLRKTKNVMKGLTAKEEEIMGFVWEKGPLFLKEMLAFYEEPKPHCNTLSTIVRGLEDKGFLSHHTYGNTYQY